MEVRRIAPREVDVHARWTPQGRREESRAVPEADRVASSCLDNLWTAYQNWCCSISAVIGEEGGRSRVVVEE